MESPFQLLQGAELKSEAGRTVYLVRLNDNLRNNQQMREVLKLFDISDVLFVRSKYKALLIFYMPVILFLSFLARRFYVGDENSILFRLLRGLVPKEKIVLLDDGVATLNLSSIRDYKRITIFECVSGDRNKLNKLRLLVEQVEKQGEVNIIVGGKLVEENICSVITYEKILGQMISDLQFKENRIVYIPHRGEDLDRLKIMASNYSFEIYLNELPVELIGLELRTNVASVFSVMSTALFSMSLIYRNAVVKVYPLESSEILSRNFQIDNLYKIMRNQKFFGFLGEE